MTPLDGKRREGHALCDISFLYLFFFQAEDGIRDIGVTGVQTCALPISHDPLGFMAKAAFALGTNLGGVEGGLHLAGGVAADEEPDFLVGGIEEVVEPNRSEERRVGKECRSRWSPYH